MLFVAGVTIIGVIIITYLFVDPWLQQVFKTKEYKSRNGD